MFPSASAWKLEIIPQPTMPNPVVMVIVSVSGEWLHIFAKARGQRPVGTSGRSVPLHNHEIHGSYENVKANGGVGAEVGKRRPGRAITTGQREW